MTVINMLQISAVEFEDEPVEYAETQRPDFALVCQKRAVLHYADRVERHIVYIKCLPSLLEQIAQRHIDGALSLMERLYLSGDITGWSGKVVLIKDLEGL